MMSQLREDLLNSIGVAFQRMTDAVERGETRQALRAKSRIEALKRRLAAARDEDHRRYLHVGDSERSCMVCRDEDDHSVVVQAWNSCEGCEVTRFRSMASAQRSLQQAGYVSMAAVA